MAIEKLDFPFIEYRTSSSWNTRISIQLSLDNELDENLYGHLLLHWLMNVFSRNPTQRNPIFRSIIKLNSHLNFHTSTSTSVVEDFPP